jgi:uncharacterized membrane protein YdbT with pleckstrin-like domain
LLEDPEAYGIISFKTSGKRIRLVASNPPIGRRKTRRTRRRRRRRRKKKKKKTKKEEEEEEEKEEEEEEEEEDPALVHNPNDKGRERLHLRSSKSKRMKSTVTVSARNRANPYNFVIRLILWLFYGDLLEVTLEHVHNFVANLVS